MGKWKNPRRFGPGPYVLGFQRLNWGDAFPFSVPAVAKIEQLSLRESVTLLAGENGTGKSTILEAIAAAIGFAEHGGELSRLGDLPAVPRSVLDDVGAPLLAPVLSATKPRNGYFLRAESFFNVAEFIDSGDRFAPDLSLYGDVPLHAQSHGESFLALAANRFGPDGLYLLDEPEAALSVKTRSRHA
jgi:predicted ATPase